MWARKLKVSLVYASKFALFVLLVAPYVVLQMNEKAEEAISEQSMADLLYLTENDGKLRLDQYCM